MRGKPFTEAALDKRLLADVSVEESCQNGTSYMCADQAPWLVNDHLAKGSAALSIEGGSEASWRCACYDLTFTWGLADGKRMVVQATHGIRCARL